MKLDKKDSTDKRVKVTAKNKRFVRYADGAEMYSMGLSKFQQIARDAGACYKGLIFVK